MRKCLLAYITTTFVLSVAAQNNSENLLSKGEMAFHHAKYDSAVTYWSLIIKDHKNDSTYFRALNKLPLAFEALGDIKKATQGYLAVLAADLQGTDNLDLKEPNSNYKHLACLRMARMYATASQYQYALQFLDWAENKYKYQTTEGSIYEKRLVSISSARNEYYEKLGKTDSAIYTLISKIFNSDISVQFSNFQTLSEQDYYSKITSDVLSLIERRYTKEGFKSEIDKSLTQIATSIVGEISVATFRIYGLTYKIYSSNKNSSEKEFMDQIKKSALYLSL